MLTEQEESELIEVWIATRDEKLLVRLLTAFEPLVLKFARRYRSYGIAQDELVAVGNLALVETANKFKPEKGFKFSTYASHWIRGMMLIFIASNYFSFTLKSQKVKKVFFRLRHEVMLAQKQKGEMEDTYQIMMDMSEKFGCSADQLQQIYLLMQRPNLSLNEPITGESGEGGTLGDMIACQDLNPEENMIQVSQKKTHQKILYSTMDRVLTDRERTIIEGQLLQEEDKERTLQDLADEFKLSRERIRQIRDHAIEKLERAIRNTCSTRQRRYMF